MRNAMAPCCYAHSYPQRNYKCRRRGRPGEPCAFYRFNQCHAGLSCTYNDVCHCHGYWVEAEDVCYSDGFCRAQAESTSLEGDRDRFESDRAYFNRAAKRCMCKLGVRCGDADRASHLSSFCPANSTMTVDEHHAKCICDEGLVSMEGKYCQKQARRGEECQEEVDQLSDPCIDGSKCHQGTCQCVDPRTHWDEAKKRCLAPVDRFCTRDDECVANTFCSSMLCKCPGKFQAYPNGHCGQPFGGTCSLDEPTACVEGMGMECMDGLCRCRDMVGQFYHAPQARCLTLIGSPCGNFSTCGEMAECEEATGKCECDGGAGLVPSENLVRCTRALQYGDACSPNQCDTRRGLACSGITSRCVCVDSALIYHNKGRVKGEFCLAPAGTRCGQILVPGSCMPTADAAGVGDGGKRGDCEHYMLECMPGAECVKQAGEGGLGVCRATGTEGGHGGDAGSSWW